MSSKTLLTAVNRLAVTTTATGDTPNYAVARNASAIIHMPFLDGMRGLAALYVACHHACSEIKFVDKPGGSIEAVAEALLKVFSYGHFAVGVFIVLSGYCLMLPVARSVDGNLRGGTINFIRRRAHRILPPYYAALVLSLLLIASAPLLQQRNTTGWDVALPAFGSGNLLAHLLMVHNLRIGWLCKINPSLWSVATEWDIYFVFALILRPVWKRWGNGALLLSAFVVGLAPYYLLHKDVAYWACPWYVGLFAFGMVAAVVQSDPQMLRARALVAKWAGWWTFGLLCLLIMMIRRDPLWPYHYIPFDCVLGLTASCLILYCSAYAAQTTEKRGVRPLILQVFEAQWAVKLGAFSYSVYLLYHPIVVLMYRGLRTNHWSECASLILLMTIGVPLTVLIAYGFHILFERPLISGGRKTRPLTESTATGKAGL